MVSICIQTNQVFLLLASYYFLLKVAIAIILMELFPLHSGAVTSPTVLPSSTSRVVSLGIGAPGSFLSDIQMSRNISKADSDRSPIFEKDEFPDESCGHLEDCEDEAEAAASAVAVAAISSDKIVGNGFSSVSIPDAKNIGGADVHGIAEGDFSSLLHPYLVYMAHASFD